MTPANELNAAQAKTARIVSIGYRLIASLVVAACVTGCGGGHGGGDGSGAASASPAASSPATPPSSATSSDTSTSAGGGTDTAGATGDTSSTPCVASLVAGSHDATLRVIAGSPLSGGYADGGSAAARFNQPGVLARDAKGNLYVSDDGNRKIRKVCPGGNVSTVATAGALTGFAITGLTVDSHGGLYFSDVSGVHKITSPGSQIQLGTGLSSLGRLAISSQDVLFTFENRYSAKIDGGTALPPLAGLRKLDGTQAVHLWDYGMASAQGAANNAEGFTDMVLDEGAKQVYISSDLFNVVAKLSYDTSYAGVHVDVPGIRLPGDQRIQRLAADTQGRIYAFTNVLATAYRIMPDGSVVAVAGQGTSVAMPSAGQLQIRSIVGTGPGTFAFTADNAVYELKLP